MTINKSNLLLTLAIVGVVILVLLIILPDQTLGLAIGGL